MRFTLASTLASLVAVTVAFRDTSPYFLWSTSDRPTTDRTFSSSELQSATKLLEHTKNLLSSCQSDIYVVVSQPGVNTADFSNIKSVPFLRKAISNSNGRPRVSVTEAFGDFKTDDLSAFLVSHCRADVKKVDVKSLNLGALESSAPLILELDFGLLPNSTPDREERLAENDAFLQSLTSALPSDNYTVIYSTSPPSKNPVQTEPSYEPVFQEPVHMELRRQSGYVSDNTALSHAPLFEKYQYFTPGLFMGILVSLLLLSILGVAIGGVASLQVSYGAFDKENGPAAQKKQ